VLRGSDVQQLMEMKREGLSTQAISKLTGYDRKTVRKYLLKPETVPRYGPRSAQPSKLDAHKPYLQDRIAASAGLPVSVIYLVRERVFGSPPWTRFELF
jgi:transposase